MHTVITSGKMKKLVGLLVVAWVATTFGEVRVLRESTFEDLTLGDFPQNVFTGGQWGCPNNGKFFYVQNVHACQSEKALGIRIQPSVGGIWGFGYPIKGNDITNGVMIFEFDILREKLLTFNIEIRCSDGKWDIWSLGNGINLNTTTGGRPTAVLGAGQIFKPFRWYHIRYTLPLTPEAAPYPTISVTEWLTGKEWKEDWGKPNSGKWPRHGDKCFRNPAAPITFFFNFYSHYYGSPGLYYIDNIKVSHDSGNTGAQ